MNVCRICKSTLSSGKCATCDTGGKLADDTWSTVPFEQTTLTVPRIKLSPPPIGNGAFGEVYRGTHDALGITVAVKFLKVGQTTDVRQALHEARILARLDHPNLIRVFEAGDTQGVPYIVMELMDGGTCESLHLLDWYTAYDYAMQLLSGLHGLHQANVLHRDIKPANCLRRLNDSRIKLSDLGLAVDWSTSTIEMNLAGTPSFMAPELFDQVPNFTFASDVYALGLTIASLILDRTPVPRGSLSEIKSWARSGARPNFYQERSDLPIGFCRLIQQMCTADVGQRPGTEEALAELVSLNRSPRRITSDYRHNVLPVKPDETLCNIGQWRVGTRYHSSDNWTHFVVSHLETGRQARMMLLNPGAPISPASANILVSAERASNLSHENITGVLDWGRHENRPFIVTEPQGKTIEELMSVSNWLSETEVVKSMLDAARGLEYLHQQGMVFQLIDPGAIAAKVDGVSSALVWPAFCEIAGKKASKRAAILAYAPPELREESMKGFRPKNYEPSIDMYGLGATFFCATVGRDVYYILQNEKLSESTFMLAERLTAPVARLISDLVSDLPANRPSSADVVERLSRIALRTGVN